MSERFIPQDPQRRFAGIERRLRQAEFGVPIPTFRAKIEGTVITVGFTSTTAILWDLWENGDERIFGDLTISGGRLEFVRPLVPGLYVHRIEINWDEDTGFDKTVILNDGWGYPDRFSHGDSPLFAGGTTVGTFFKDYWPFDPSQIELDSDNPPEPLAEWGVQVSQSSGINQDLLDDFSYWSIYYLGGISVPNPTPAA